MSADDRKPSRPHKGRPRDEQPSDGSPRDAKGTGGLTFEPPSSSGNPQSTLAFAPDLAPVSASGAPLPRRPTIPADAIATDASPRRGLDRNSPFGVPPSNLSHGYDARRDETREDGDSDGLANPVASMLSALPEREDRQRSLIDEVQNVLREQFGAKEQPSGAIHLPERMERPDAAPSRDGDGTPPTSGFQDVPPTGSTDRRVSTEGVYRSHVIESFDATLDAVDAVVSIDTSGKVSQPSVNAEEPQAPSTHLQTGVTHNPFSRDPNSTLQSHDIIDAEIASDEDEEEVVDVPFVEPWTPVSDRTQSIEIAPPSDPAGTPVGTASNANLSPDGEAENATSQSATSPPPGPTAQRPNTEPATAKPATAKPATTAPAVSKDGNDGDDDDAFAPTKRASLAFGDITQPLTPVPQQDRAAKARPPSEQMRETMLSFPALNPGQALGPDKPAPSSSAADMLPPPPVASLPTVPVSTVPVPMIPVRTSPAAKSDASISPLMQSESPVSGALTTGARTSASSENEAPTPTVSMSEAPPAAKLATPRSVSSVLQPAATYPLARATIAKLLAADTQPPGHSVAPLAEPPLVSPPKKTSAASSRTPWRAKKAPIEAQTVLDDEDTSSHERDLLSPPKEDGAERGVSPDTASPSTKEDAPARAQVEPEKEPAAPAEFFTEKTDRNAFEMPPLTPAPISILDGEAVADDDGAADVASTAGPNAEMTETSTGKMDMFGLAPRAISIPDMEAVTPEKLAKAAADAIDDKDAPDTLVNFSIGPAVMRKPAEVATPKRAADFSAASDGRDSASQGRLQTLVDTMLVGQDAESKDGEVHLQFKDDVLRGLYVSLVREPEGLVAKFVVADATVRRQIDGHAQSLVDRLSAKGMDVVGYRIEMRDGTEAPERLNPLDDDGYDGF